MRPIVYGILSPSGLVMKKGEPVEIENAIGMTFGVHCNDRRRTHNVERCNLRWTCSLRWATPLTAIMYARCPQCSPHTVSSNPQQRRLVSGRRSRCCGERIRHLHVQP